MTEYRNPQDDPGSQKRLLLAFFLVFVMIAVMQFFLKPPAPKPGEPQQNAKQQQAQSTPAPPAPPAPE